MFLINLVRPQITFKGDSGGGGGGGGSSSSKKPSKPKSQAKSKIGTDAGDGMTWQKSSTSNAIVRVRTPSSSSPSTSRSSSSSSGGRNLDADMFAGSGYAPTKNAGTSKASQYTYSNDTYGPNRTTSSVTGSTKDFNSKTSVTAKDLADGNVTTYRAKNGIGSVTVAQGTAFKDVPQVDVGGRKNSEVYNTRDVATPTYRPPVTTNTGGGGSTAPVTAPEKIDPRDGVGGGRDGGKARTSKASTTNEDKIAVERAAQGVNRYKIRNGQAVAASSRGRRTNSLSIRQNRSS